MFVYELDWRSLDCPHPRELGWAMEVSTTCGSGWVVASINSLGSFGKSSYLLTDPITLLLFSHMRLCIVLWLSHRRTDVHQNRNLAGRSEEHTSELQSHSF